MSGMTRVRR